MLQTPIAKDTTGRINTADGAGNALLHTFLEKHGDLMTMTSLIFSLFAVLITVFNPKGGWFAIVKRRGKDENDSKKTAGKDEVQKDGVSTDDQNNKKSKEDGALAPAGYVTQKKFDEELFELKKQLKQIQSTLDGKANTRNLDISVSDLDSRLKLAEKALEGESVFIKDGNGEQRAASNPPVTAASVPALEPAEQTAPTITIFAKLPDIEGGFSPNILTPVQNGEQVYEIEITGDTAAFGIAAGSDAQSYALSDFKYLLAGACEFINQPLPNSRIITRSKGTLVKIANDWQIDKKAKIEFVR